MSFFNFPSHRRKRKKSETEPAEVPLKYKTDVTVDSYDNPTMIGNKPHGQKGGYAREELLFFSFGF